ncbi:MAG: Ig-like domain-containing protein [Gemmatimonadota bacterium]
MSMRAETVFLLIATLALSSCGNPSTVAEPTAADGPAMLNIVPPNAATGVDPASPIVIAFTHPMLRGTEALVVLHKGSLTGPLIAGTASWSDDRTVLTFKPSTVLESKTTYVLHLSPNLQGVNGQRISQASCARLGGRSVTPGMLGPGPHGPGMMGGSWRAPDGTYGMIFTFTTA